MDKLKIVKTFVFIITFLLIFGTLLLLSKLWQKSRQKPFWPETISLNQPEGTAIKSIHTENNKIYIQLQYGGLPDRIAVIDAQSGKIISVIIIK